MPLASPLRRAEARERRKNAREIRAEHMRCGEDRERVLHQMPPGRAEPIGHVLAADSSASTLDASSLGTTRSSRTSARGVLAERHDARAVLPRSPGEQIEPSVVAVEDGNAAGLQPFEDLRLRFRDRRLAVEVGDGARARPW